MRELERQAQAMADACGQRCWIVIPPYGRPYIAHSLAQIQPGFDQLQPVLPATGHHHSPQPR